MNVKLTGHSEDLLRKYLARGRYHTPEEVIERALDMLAERELVFSAEPSAQPDRASILELQGLGKAIWQGIDAQEYVERERSSWAG
jgi:hypothetical protein